VHVQPALFNGPYEIRHFVRRYAAGYAQYYFLRHFPILSRFIHGTKRDRMAAYELEEGLIGA
jgi:hypothetical protein